MNDIESKIADRRSRKDPSDVECASVPKCEYELELQRWNRWLEVSGPVGLILYDPKGSRDL